MERIIVDQLGRGEFVVPATGLGLVLIEHQAESPNGSEWTTTASTLVAAQPGESLYYDLFSGRLSFGVGKMDPITLTWYATTELEQSWTVPAHCYSIAIACWGPGGQAANGVDGVRGGGGGGGGGYSAKTIAISPGRELKLKLGSSATPCDVYVKYSGGATIVTAYRGQPGSADQGGAGGGTDGGADVSYAGGDGGDASFATRSGGGGGGESASASGAGNAGSNASGSTGGPGGTGTNGDDGGAGGGAGKPGAKPPGYGLYGECGGGGGGGGDGDIGEFGGNGVIKITYTPSYRNPPGTLAAEVAVL